MGRKVGRRLAEYDPDEASEWEHDVHEEAEHHGRARSQWKATSKKLSQRAAKCPRVYDKATDLQKKARSGDAPACNDAAVAKAVLQSFAGPCKKAEKSYRKAIMSCKRIGR